MGVQEMRPEKDRILWLLQRRMRRYQRTLVLLTLVWVVMVGVGLVAQMSPEDMSNHRSQIIQEQIRACSGEFSQRFDCTQDILLDGQRTGIWEVIKRISLTFLLPSVAWGVWWVVLRRIRQIYWLPPSIDRFRFFA